MTGRAGPRGQAARAPRGRPDAGVGLVLARSGRQPDPGPFWPPFLAGLAAFLEPHDVTLRMGLAEGPEQELDVQRGWWRRRQIAGAVVVDVRTRDERLPVLGELGMPVIVAGPPGLAGGLPAEWTDDEAAMDSVVRHFAALGHRRIARVAWDPGLGHTALRTAAFSRIAAELGLHHTTVTTYPGDPDPGRCTRRLLLAPRRPTAVVYDSTSAAAAALGVARQLDIDVPSGLSLIAWDDSPLCAATRPALSVVRHDVHAYGARTASALLRLIDGLSPAAG
ncbi:MAG: substrate-binding domain-containing protein, partial [Actinomycetia bacterium]|nr:substrate-binding domain-containing protein [Actinomycetes bacterium]